MGDSESNTFRSNGRYTREVHKIERLSVKVQYEENESLGLRVIDVSEIESSLSKVIIWYDSKSNKEVLPDSELYNILESSYQSFIS